MPRAASGVVLSLMMEGQQSMLACLEKVLTDKSQSKTGVHIIEFLKEYLKHVGRNITPHALQLFVSLGLPQE